MCGTWNCCGSGHLNFLYEQSFLWTVWAGEAGFHVTDKHYHHTGPLQNGSRCMIGRIHSFEEKRLIVHLPAESGAQTYVEKRISIYPDLSAKLLKQGTTCNEVRSQLCKLYLWYGFIHPAKYILTFQNTTHTFSTAKEAQSVFEKHNTEGDEPTDIH
jgi:hypothetical protein